MAENSKDKTDNHHRNPDAPFVFVQAASVVVLRGDTVLMVKRGKPPLSNLWSFPGGKLEHGETPAETAVREAYEETGLTVTLLGPLGTNTATIPATRTSPERRFEINVFIGSISSGVPRAGDDALDAQFIGTQDVAKFATTDGAASWIEKARLFRDNLRDSHK